MLFEIPKNTDVFEKNQESRGEKQEEKVLKISYNFPPWLVVHLFIGTEWR